MTSFTPEARSFLWLPEKELNRIASEVYGSTYVAQQTGDMLPNDSYHLFTMDEETVEDLLYAGDVPGHYLGLQPVPAGSGDHGGSYIARYADGVTWFEYWLGLDYSSDPGRRSNESTPQEWEDAREYVYSYDFQVYRQAPTPELVIADLIRREVLPYGEYMMEVSW